MKRSNNYPWRYQRDGTYCGQHYAQFMLWRTSKGQEGWASWNNISGRWDCLVGVGDADPLTNITSPSTSVSDPFTSDPRPSTGWYKSSSHLHEYYRPALELDELGWCSKLVHEYSKFFYELGWILYIITYYYMLWELWICYVLIMWIVFWCWKLVIFKLYKLLFFRKIVNGKRDYPKMYLLEESQIVFKTHE